MQPEISVLIPARNEGSRLAATILSIARARASDRPVEFVVVDDCSSDGTVANLVSAAPRLLREKNIDVVVGHLEQHGGTYAARNRAAELARGEILFITDAHVQFSQGWDDHVVANVRPGRIFAATISKPGTSFRGYGCRLLVPFMGTSWNEECPEGEAGIPIATCAATILQRELFLELGGYDAGMKIYGGGEPEFSVRAWLQGAEIHPLPAVEVLHDFKSKDHIKIYMNAIRPFWVHNCLRFGLLYLSEPGCMQLMRFYAKLSPGVFQTAMQMLDEGDVWQRRAELESRRDRHFGWFVDRFAMKNQIGGEII